MVLVYSNEITSRIEYIFKFIFNQILNTEVHFTENSLFFQKSQHPKINYSFEKFNDELYFKPHRLLYCKALIAPSINPVWYKGQKYFFESSTDSDLPFDMFAASFYLVTRYEEYLESENDILGRFQAKKSLLYKYNLLEKPVVNTWAILLAQLLQDKYPGFTCRLNKFDFVSTIDVDSAWAFKNKSLSRTAGAMFKAILNRRMDELRDRIRVLSGSEKDPYDTYEYLNFVFRGNEHKVKYFFLLGNYGRFDKNISYKNRHFRKLIQTIHKKYEVGIHPSFASGKKGGKKKIMLEKGRLQKIIQQEVDMSRQHYLRLKFPQSYRRLIKAGIRGDFTMGYPELPGFRAGVCTPFYFYDLKKEKTTNLLITPFQVMDGTLCHYMQLSPENAVKLIEKLMREVKKVGGTFVGIWHNETVNDLGCWKGYRKVFEHMHKLGFQWANE